MTTTSGPVPSPSVGPSAVLPVVISTRVTSSPASKETPRNDRLPSGTVPTGTKNFCEPPPRKKNSIDVVLATSTSLNTAPKPFTVAGCAPPLPGTENKASVTLLPSGVKTRERLKGENSVKYEALITPRLPAPRGLTDAWVKPTPGVANVAPRAWKAVKGVAGGTGAASMLAVLPPSQLISRRPLGNGVPTAPLFGLPRAV